MQTARPDTRTPHALSTDLHRPLTRHEASVESDRCYFCHDAPCITACPTGIDIPLFIRQINTGNARGAARTIFDENIFGGMCARVCPTETLCEQACVRQGAEDKPVRIGELQRFATDTLMATGQQPYERAADSGRHVAVVGAGPAGLSCAHRLSLYGHRVTVYDSKPKAGGLNEYGIAAYKSVDNFAQREVSFILSLGGIAVEHDQVLGVEFTLNDLKQRFDAVFVGVGLASVNSLGIENDTLPGVEDAVAFIARLRQAEDPTTLSVGRRVVVLGGGMTAIDAAVQSKLLGAEEVTLVYRRGQSSMNASAFEQALAQTRGVLIRTWMQPARLVAAEGRVAGVEFDYTEVQDGKLSPTGETLTLVCDQVLKAIGQQFAIQPAGNLLNLNAGRIRVDAERRTNDPMIWAGGDCVEGGDDLTVSAVQDGKLAAQSINKVLAHG